MKTSWFTFGQVHVHSVNGVTFDKDIVVEITAEDPRQVMVDTFGLTWGMEYYNPPDNEFMELFPRGIYKLTKDT